MEKQKVAVNEIGCNETMRRKKGNSSLSSAISKDSESVVIETKISWKDIWDWETARITGARIFILLNEKSSRICTARSNEVDK